MFYIQSKHVINQLNLRKQYLYGDCKTCSGHIWYHFDYNCNECVVLNINFIFEDLFSTFQRVKCRFKPLNTNIPTVFKLNKFNQLLKMLTFITLSCIKRSQTTLKFNLKSCLKIKRPKASPRLTTKYFCRDLVTPSGQTWNCFKFRNCSQRVVVKLLAGCMFVQINTLSPSI